MHQKNNEEKETQIISNSYEIAPIFAMAANENLYIGAQRPKTFLQYKGVFPTHVIMMWSWSIQTALWKCSRAFVKAVTFATITKSGGKMQTQLVSPLIKLLHNST